MRIVALFAASAAAAVTVNVDPDVAPLPLPASKGPLSSTSLFQAAAPEEFKDGVPQVLLSSLSPSFGTSAQNETTDSSAIYPSSGSLIRGALDAWAQHQHLVLRPDEVWFEVLVQMNFYMTAHAEDVRHLFVDFDGKQEIKVQASSWTDVIAGFSRAIAGRVKPAWMLDWIMPGFSTSNSNDEMTATVLMMGLMQHYFSFTGGIVCGLPQVTLLGDKFDWQRLLDKLDQLPNFGAQASDYATQLKPIFSKFVQTFDEPDADDVKAFWKQIVRAERTFSCGAGPIEYNVSGWMLAFMHWREDGKLRVSQDMMDYEEKQPPKDGDNVVTVDGVRYFPTSMNSFVIGYAKAPLKMQDYPEAGKDTKAYVLAGNIGINRTLADGNKYVTTKPMSSWFLYAPQDANHTVKSPYGSNLELLDTVNAMKAQESCPGNNIFSEGSPS